MQMRCIEIFLPVANQKAGSKVNQDKNHVMSKQEQIFNVDYNNFIQPLGGLDFSMFTAN